MLWLFFACRGPIDVDSPGQGDDTDDNLEGVGPGPAVEPPDPSVLWAEDTLLTYEIELDPSAVDDLRDDPYEYVEGAFIFEGKRYEPVGIRIKGQNSYLPIDQKPSWKIKFDRYDESLDFMGLKDLTFNNMSNDYSMMHERLAYAVYREAGLPASRAMHALIVLNGEPYGLYTNLEGVEKSMISRFFDDEDGTLWEAWDVDFKDEYVESWSLDYGEERRDRIQAVADAMEKSPDAAIAEASATLDYSQFLRWWAVSVAVGQYDSYPYGYPGDDCYWYDPPGGRLTILPWGADETFYDAGRDIDAVYGVLAATCTQSPDCMAEWRGYLEESLDLVEAMDLLGMHDAAAAQIAEAVAEDEHRPYSASTVADYQAVMREFIRTRRTYVEAQLP